MGLKLTFPPDITFPAITQMDCYRSTYTLKVDATVVKYLLYNSLNQKIHKVKDLLLGTNS